MYQLWPGQAQFMTILTIIRPLWPWPSTYLKNVSNGTSPPRGQQLCKIIKLFWNPCINVQVKARRSIIYDHFDLYLTPVTLTFSLPKNVSNGTSPPQGQQLCKIILKSMRKCTSYGPDEFNTCIWPFWPSFDPCDLDLQLPKKMFQMALLLLKGNNCAKLFWNPCVIVQVMVQTNPDGCTDARNTPN